MLFAIAPLATPPLAVHAADRSSAAQSGTATLIGTVANSATSRTLEGARVVLMGTGREAVTDVTGTYRFDNIAPGSVTLSVSYTGLNTLEVSAQVSPGGTSRQDVGLTADIYTMSKFVVSSEREGNALAITLQPTLTERRASLVTLSADSPAIHRPRLSARRGG